MPSFWKHVNKVIKEADIIIEVLDARSIKETRNPEIEYKVKEKQKRLLYVITKCDLVDIEKVKNECLKNVNKLETISTSQNNGTFPFHIISISAW